MRTRPDPVLADVVNRRLELLRAEIAHDWRADEVATAHAGEAASRGAPVSAAAVGAEWWADHTRVAMPVPVGPAGPSGPACPARASDDPAEGPAFRPPPAGPIPVPGRHAARRMTAGALVPEQLRGRVALGPWQLAVVALGVALALAIACWWVVRGSATALPATTTAPAAPLVGLRQAGGAATTAASPGVSSTSGMPGTAGVYPPAGGVAGASSAARVTVDVEGKVRQPGVKVLPNGSRIIDAIRAAGGAPRRGDLTGLNLAALLADGQQIVVGGPARASTAAGGAAALSAPSAGAPGPGALIDLNTADATQLDTLPGVGPVTAQSILQWRAQNGRFTSVDQLMSVDGIGPKTYAQIQPFVTV